MLLVLLAAADFELHSTTCNGTWQQLSMVAAVGGVAVVVLGSKVWKSRTGRTCKK